MEGNTYLWIFPEDGVLLGRNALEQNKIVHVSSKLRNEFMSNEI